MKNLSPEQTLESLSTLTPKASVLTVLEQRVFSEVNPTLIPSPVMMHKSGFYMSWYQLQFAAAAFSCLLLAVYIVPKHTAYQTSISSLAETQQLTDTLHADVTSVGQLEQSLATTRQAFNSLSLRGTTGLYTQEQCQEAYILYDGYLDHVAIVVNEKLVTATSDEQKQALTTLKEMITTYKVEAGKRIMLYPKK